MPPARTISARAAAAVVLAMPTVVAFSAGGFFEGARLRAAIVAWIGVAVVVIALPDSLRLPRRTAIAVLALLGLAAWTTLSILWSPLRDSALNDAERLWLYAGYALLAAIAVRGPVTRAVEPAIAAGATIVGGYALATRLLPSVIHSDRSLSAGARLDQPLTYWNALGLLMAMAVVLLLRLAADDARSFRLRAVAAAFVPVNGLALYLTFSRGTLAALAVGVIVLLLICRGRRVIALAIGCLGCAAAAAAIASRFPAVDSLDGNGSKQGAAMLVILLALCTLSAGVQVAVDYGVVDHLRLRSATGLVSLLVIVVLALGALVAITRSPDAPPTTDKSGVVLPRDRGRLTTLKTNRPSYWKVAINGFADDPLKGVGAHGFQQLWLQKRHIAESVQDAHSLYLETAVELGIVGVLLLLTWLGSTASAFVAAIRTPAGRQLVAGSAAASAAFLVHAALDWDWEMPAVSLVLLALLAVALATASEPGVERNRG